MTTAEVLGQLVAAGWHWEAMAPGLEPCLTNGPPGQEFCVSCGHWVVQDDYDDQVAACKRCWKVRTYPPRSSP